MNTIDEKIGQARSLINAIRKEHYIAVNEAERAQTKIADRLREQVKQLAAERDALAKELDTVNREIDELHQNDHRENTNLKAELDNLREEIPPCPAIPAMEQAAERYWDEHAPWRFNGPRTWAGVWHAMYRAHAAIVRSEQRRYRETTPPKLRPDVVAQLGTQRGDPLAQGLDR